MIIKVDLFIKLYTHTYISNDARRGSEQFTTYNLNCTFNYREAPAVTGHISHWWEWDLKGVAWQVLSWERLEQECERRQLSSRVFTLNTAFVANKSSLHFQSLTATHTAKGFDELQHFPLKEHAANYNVASCARCRGWLRPFSY